MKVYLTAPNTMLKTDKVLFLSEPTTLKDLFFYADPSRTFLNGQQQKSTTTKLENNDQVYILPNKTYRFDPYLAEIFIFKQALNKPQNLNQYSYVLLHHNNKQHMVPRGFTAFDFLTTLLEPEHEPSDIFVNGNKVLDEYQFTFRHNDQIALEAIRCQ